MEGNIFIWLILFVCTEVPISSVKLCSSLSAIFGLSVICLINSRPSWSVSLGGLPFLDRFLLWYQILSSPNNRFNGPMNILGFLSVFKQNQNFIPHLESNLVFFVLFIWYYRICCVGPLASKKGKLITTERVQISWKSTFSWSKMQTSMIKM